MAQQGQAEHAVAMLQKPGAAEQVKEHLSLTCLQQVLCHSILVGCSQMPKNGAELGWDMLINDPAPYTQTVNIYIHQQLCADTDVGM